MNFALMMILRSRPLWLLGLLLGLAITPRAQASYLISQPLEDGQFAVVNHGRGQSFTVSDPGAGTDSLSGATQVRLDSVSFRYGTSSLASAAGGSGSVLYVYDALPTSLSDLNTGLGALFGSTSSSASGVTASHFFTSAFLDTSTTYYLFYNSNRQFRYSFSGNPYEGGRIWYRETASGDWMMTGGADQLDAFFEIQTTVIPEPASFVGMTGLVVLAWSGARRRRH